MRRIRFSIAGLMAAVAVAALAVAALRASTPAWAGAMLMLVWSVLGLAIVSIVYRPRGERAWWLGFALFGCGYLVLAFWSEINFDSLPTTTLLLFLSSKVDPSIQKAAWSRTGELHWTFLHIAHCLWALVAAVLGGAAAHLLSAAASPDREQAVVEMSASDRPPATWWRRPALMWLSGAALVAAFVLAAAKSAPGLWAGVVFLLTCGMLGLATLGAFVGRGKRRTMWLGAALFGWGFMYFTFGRTHDDGWPYPPTTHLLNALRGDAVPHVSDFLDASQRNNSRNRSILEALERPIPMHFPKGAPLEDVLKHVKAQTTIGDFKGIPIYVDPVGLNFARRTMQSTVIIDAEGAALKNSLTRCLRQLDLSFALRDGFMMITEAGRPLPAYEDPFLIVGHCLLALLAAAVGGVLAPLVADARARDPPNELH